MSASSRTSSTVPPNRGQSENNLGRGLLHFPAPLILPFGLIASAVREEVFWLV